MCFSAQASFAAGVILEAAGVASLTKVRSKREIPLALIPIFFGLQQFVEGIQWLSDKPSEVSFIAGYIFLGFAFFFWPLYIPFSILLVEPNARVKKILRIFLLLGFGVAAFLGFIILKEPLAIAVTQNHIEYKIWLPWTWGLFPYALTTCGSCLVSSHKIIRWLGAGILLGLAASLLFFYLTFGSVWCFAAAILSAMIYLHFRRSSG